MVLCYITTFPYKYMLYIKDIPPLPLPFSISTCVNTVCLLVTFTFIFMSYIQTWF